MIIITDNKKLTKYIYDNKIDEIFGKDIIPFAKLLFFNKNEHICRADEKLDYLYFLVEGRAKVYTLLRNGKILSYRFYDSLEVIGDIEFIHQDRANSNIEVIENTYCIGIPIEIIKMNYLNDSSFLKYMCESLANKLKSFSKASSINLLYPLENRVANYLLTNNNETGTYYNFTEMSELLGTSYRHLLRILDKLSKNNTIQKDGNIIQIIDLELLKEMSEDLF
ncbi:cyclic nucleotide-binding domain-containing protein [Helicovermis profundi]|uniref:Transcriptional regulator YeiL n=1 Tax=Helicovermis profundi TaxID=3065157 RepID=A0AAU9E7B5_9FIRM|nr:transcriptional regulator YeiL [Clostridia bacterium S502]